MNENDLTGTGKAGSEMVCADSLLIECDSSNLGSSFTESYNKSLMTSAATDFLRSSNFSRTNSWIVLKEELIEIDLCPRLR